MENNNLPDQITVAITDDDLQHEYTCCSACPLHSAVVRMFPEFIAPLTDDRVAYGKPHVTVSGLREDGTVRVRFVPGLDVPEVHYKTLEGAWNARICRELTEGQLKTPYTITLNKIV